MTNFLAGRVVFRLKKKEGKESPSTKLPALDTAALMAALPRFAADSGKNDPPKEAMGVRTAETMTTSVLLNVAMARRPLC